MNLQFVNIFCTFSRSMGSAFVVSLSVIIDIIIFRFYLFIISSLRTKIELEKNLLIKKIKKKTTKNNLFYVPIRTLNCFF